MNYDEYENLVNVVDQEVLEYRRNMVQHSGLYVFDQAKIIYAFNFIADCLRDFDIAEKIDKKLLPRRNIVANITDFYLLNHTEISETDFVDMFDYQKEDLLDIFSEHTEM